MSYLWFAVVWLTCGFLAWFFPFFSWWRKGIKFDREEIRPLLLITIGGPICLWAWLEMQSRESRRQHAMRMAKLQFDHLQDMEQLRIDHEIKINEMLSKK